MSKSLIPAQRRERILEYLAIHRIARSTDMSRLLDASEATVRRDLLWLEEEGFIQRTHGGAILKQQLDFEAEYQNRARMFSEEKRIIGEFVYRPDRTGIVERYQKLVQEHKGVE